MKRVLGILAIVSVIAYLVYALSFYSSHNGQTNCNGLVVQVSNVTDNQFIDTDKIKESIKASSYNPINKPVAEINTLEIEHFILKNQHARKAKVFITNQSDVKIVIEERKPILRVIPNIGKSFYVDEDGNRMKLSDRYTAYVPLATGNIKDSITINDLYKFALFLQDNSFWNAQIDQIVVNDNNDIQFVTRVGNHIVTIGELDNLETKLERLLVFYKDGLNKIGWNKYSDINLKFSNQVICSKKN